jgi:AcrR family transcriptional regulator
MFTKGKYATPEVRRAQILNTAPTCFVRKGYHQTTMDDIVEEGGMSKGLLYWYFDSKRSSL